MTRAYSTAKTSRGTLVVANLQYSGIVFAAIYSVVLFNDQIPRLGWLGMVLIVGSGIVATVLRAAPHPTPCGSGRTLPKCGRFGHTFFCTCARQNTFLGLTALAHRCAPPGASTHDPTTLISARNCKRCWPAASR